MIRINLLPVRAEKRKENVKKQAILLGCYVAFLVLVAVGIQLGLISDAESKRRRIEAQKKEIVKLDETIKQVQNYNAMLADLTAKLNVVIGLEQKQRGPARVFKELALLVPEKLWIEKASDNAGQLTLEGYAIDQQTVSQFMMNLERSALFQKVRLDVTKQASKGGALLQNFTLVVTVRQPNQTESAKPAGKAG